MVGYIFPGQGAQFEGMASDLLLSDQAVKLFDEAREILGFDIAEIMKSGSGEDLKETKVTQPAVFLHSVIKARLAGDQFKPDFVAGHSLGEFSALTAAGALSFEDGLSLVSKRAIAMQKACELEQSTMAAILGLEDQVVEDICNGIDELVVPANYNCPGQLVISGSMAGIQKAVDQCTEAGARRALILNVGGAFHSPLMEPAREDLEKAINVSNINQPSVPVFQNVDGKPQSDPAIIKENLIKQLTAPVLWTQTMQNMISAGVESFVEVGGTGKVLIGLVKKVDRKIPCEVL
ncbi:ACP S-malonyltransferase [Portibacter lacus]|uniref:Malonyl CoA-acyl carrier protein transacylase n=1 Tax=Portibacter lacus TaxID=1099794 RepID=A0AA37SU96_9BACT|nr:ACP S-malonyltransferase [Portibacter lacus]GLR18333.1 malonyl CoA-acyl carrier protein transacylase [Portibacter lacus]